MTKGRERCENCRFHEYKRGLCNAPLPPVLLVIPGVEGWFEREEVSDDYWCALYRRKPRL
jgi:hypothetical protein